MRKCGLANVVRASAILIILFLSRDAACQELKNLGIVCTQVLSRTRLGSTSYSVGDMILVTAEQGPNTSGMSISTHMEYQTGPEIGTNNWRPVPTTSDPLGKSYTSGKYPGLRDFVTVETRVSVPTQHQICLFMPHDAAAIQEGTQFSRRYVIRVWDQNGNEIESKALSLPADSVSMERQGPRRIIRTTVAVACSKSIYTGSGPANLEPEAARTVSENGTSRFFNTSSGQWVCP